MAESKGALIAKTVQKHAGRAKEKLLQNLGKVDRTLDDIFEEHLQNFNRQHQQATRLQKEFNNYIRCIRAVQTASKSLMEAITEVYESSWSGHDLLYVQAQNMEMLWQDFSHKLGDQVLIPLNTYTGQFPETRKKIEKRGRKLVDYDGQRHSFQNLQANAAKRRDDVKVTRGREQLEEAKRTYEILNSELHDELPALYDSRVLFYVNNLQTLFSAEQLFHAETAKVYNELEAITDKLATESQRGSYVKRPVLNNVHSGTLPRHNGTSTNSPTTASPIQTPSTPATPTTPSAVAREPAPESSLETAPQTATAPPSINGHKQDSPVAEKQVISLEKEIEKEIEKVIEKNDVIEIEKKPDVEKDKKVEEIYDIPADKPVLDNDIIIKDEELIDDKQTQEVYDVPVGATLGGLPAGVLYRVRATYRYTREDDDELSFDVGDVINVVHYDDPEEQEEGWLMGVKDGTNEKGMFPANFTRPI